MCSSNDTEYLSKLFDCSTNRKYDYTVVPDVFKIVHMISVVINVCRFRAKVSNTTRGHHITSR